MIFGIIELKEFQRSFEFFPKIKFFKKKKIKNKITQIKGQQNWGVKTFNKLINKMENW